MPDMPPALARALPALLSDDLNKKTSVSLTVPILTVGLAMFLAAAGTHAVLRKDVTLVVAGQARPHVTYGRTVGRALAEAGIRVRSGDEVSPSLAAPLAEGARIVLRRAVPISIAVDGRIFRLTSAAPTVGDLLHRRGIVLGESDKVFPAAGSPVWKNARVRVVRILHKVVAERSEIPFHVISSKDPATPRGIVRVKQSGRAGIRERLFRLTLADGRWVDASEGHPSDSGRPVEELVPGSPYAGSTVTSADRVSYGGDATWDLLPSGDSGIYWANGIPLKSTLR